MLSSSTMRWPMEEVRACALAGLLACEFDSSGSGLADADGSDDAGSTQGPSGASGTTASTSSSAGGTGEVETGASDATTDVDPPPGDTSSGDTGAVDGCPSPLPADWVFCEDFEGVDPAAAFSSFDDDAGALSVASLDEGGHALRIEHGPDTYSGAAWLRFGQGPAHAVAPAIEERFVEVWLSLRMRTDDHWPGGAPNHIVQIAAMDEQWHGLAAVELYGLDDQDVMDLRPKRCTDDDGSVLCADFNRGWSAMAPFASVRGNAPLFAAAQGGAWHCVELHAMLSQQGEGVAESFVDGAPDAAAADLDFLQGAPTLGWNLIHLDTWWGNAPADPSASYVDDLVVSRARTGCLP